MPGTLSPEPKQDFAEAYEFFSSDLIRDPKDFAVEWRAPKNPKFAEAKAGRWQSLVDKSGGPTGNFIAHGLPISETVELRVLSADVPSDWVTVETKALPDPLTDVHTADPFGNPLGGIRGLCKGWILDNTQLSLSSKVEKGMRCMRCGCATFRHAKMDPGAQQQEEQRKLEAAALAASQKPQSKPKAQPKAKAPGASQPKTAVATAPKAAAVASAPAPAANGYPQAAPGALKTTLSFEDELNVDRPRNEEGRLPAPFLRTAFWNTLELQSEFLATDPPEFKVEWARILEENGERGDVVVGIWTNSSRARTAEDGHRQGLFMLDNLPAGGRIAVRLRDGERSSSWMNLRTRTPEGEGAAENGTTGHITGGASACSSYAPPKAERGVDTRCLRCGRARGLHRVRREEPTAKQPGTVAQKTPAEAPAEPAPPLEPWRPEELRGAPHEGAAGHPMPLAPGLRVVAAGDVELVTNFDGSNGELLVGYGGVQVKDESGKPAKAKKHSNLERLHVVLRPDPSDGTESTGRKRWFYFGVRAADGVDPALLKGKKVRMVVNGMSDMTDLFNLDGHRPFVRNVPHEAGWTRIREPSRFICRYEGGGGRGSNVGDGGKFTISTGDAIPDSSPQEDDSIPIAKLAEIEGCFVEDGMLAVASKGSNGVKRKKMRRCHIAWDFTFEYDGGTTYFAFSEPFGYEDLQEYLGRLEGFLAGSPDPGEELPDYAPHPGALPIGADAEVLVAEGPHAGTWVKCQVVGYGTKAGQHNIQVPASPPVLNHDAAFPAVPVAMLRELEGSRTADDRKPRVGEGVYFHRAQLCTTSDGRRVDLLTVSHQGADETAFVEAPAEGLATCMPLADNPVRDFPHRKVVFVSARVHPGESPAQFAFFGFFQFILSNDPRAQLLRRHFVFKMVPMLNPDGVGRGHTRANAKGFDLNRCYSSPRQEDHEGVFHVLECLAHWSNQGRLLFYLDMHAHAHTRGCILYGNALRGAAQVWNVGFAHMCQLNTPHFDLEGSEFPPKTDKEHGGESLNSGRACVAQLCRLYHAYTLECHYSTGRLTRPVPEPPGLDGIPKHPGSAVKTFKQVRYGTVEFESIGEGIAVTLLDLHGRNPHSRLLLSRGRTLDGLLSGVSKAVHAESPYSIAAGSTKAPGMEMPQSMMQDVAQLWRVVHDQVIARDRPALTGRMVEMYGKGSLVLVAEKPDGSPWVKLAVPGGRLGGRLGTVMNGSVEAFMLTDGSQKGLGVLLEPTGMWVQLPPAKPDARGKPVPDSPVEDLLVDFSVPVPTAAEVEARQGTAPAAPLPAGAFGRPR